jgi:hypothetical protein
MLFVSDMLTVSVFTVRSSNTVPVFYGAEGEVTGRGCSTKDKIFHIECENHVMGRQSEKFCYCSYFLCNAGGRATLSRPLLLFSLVLTAGWISCSVFRTVRPGRARLFETPHV